MFISWKLINGLKKIEKTNFPVDKIQGKESFSTAKEKLLILQLFWTNVVFNWRKRDFFPLLKKMLILQLFLNQYGI